MSDPGGAGALMMAATIHNNLGEPKMNIRHYRKHVYGKELLYVVGDEGKALEKLTGKMTVSPSDLEALRALGHTIELVHEHD